MVAALLIPPAIKMVQFYIASVLKGWTLHTVLTCVRQILVTMAELAIKMVEIFFVLVLKGILVLIVKKKLLVIVTIVVIILV
jgi:hypothetical protein